MTKNITCFPLKRAGFISADVQSDVFTFTHSCNCMLSPLINSFVDDVCDLLAQAPLQVAGVASFPSQLFKIK